MTVAGAADGDARPGRLLWPTGAAPGSQAAADCGFTASRSTCPSAERRRARRSTPLWRVRGTRGKAFVDLQNDVTDDDVALAEREGFRSVEHLKRYTTLGMATDQGKTSNVTGLAHDGRARPAEAIPQTGTTTFRPPYTPVAIGALAGHHRGKDFRPTRLHAVARLGAGAGRRVRRDRAVAARPVVSASPARPTGSRPSTARCARCARRVGVCDVSTLGKIDVQGPDAGRVPRPALHQHASPRSPSARRATA